MSIRKLAFLAILLTALPSAAFAKIYAGAGVGQASVEDDVSNVHFDESTTGWKVYGGFRVLKFFGVEASYVDFGSPDGTSGAVTWKADTTAWDAFAVGVLPLGSHFEVFAKAGIVRTDTKTTVSGGSSSDSNLDTAFGVGAAFILGEHIGIRVEYEKFETSSPDNLFMYGVGVDFRF